MRVYLDSDGKYKNGWSHKVLIPTERDMQWFAMLDATANEGGYAVINLGGFLEDDVQAATRWPGFEGRVHYNIPGSGKYEGERDC
jgi:hypothetical protein